MHMYLDAWNYATFAALAIIVLGFVLLVFSFWAFRERSPSPASTRRRMR